MGNTLLLIVSVAVALAVAELLHQTCRSVAQVQGYGLGTSVPRLVEGERRTAPRLCEFCDVKDACVRGDSGARGRRVRWVDDRNAEAMRKPSERCDDAPELALLGIFNLRGGGS